MIRTAIQIATGEELDAQRLSTLIIEIHKFAPVEYRGTLVCRWMEFLHWVGVESYTVKMMHVQIRQNRTKEKKRKQSMYQRNIKRKKEVGCMNVESDKKKKGRRR